MILTVDCPQCQAMDKQPVPLGTLRVELWSERATASQPRSWGGNILEQTCTHSVTQDDIRHAVAESELLGPYEALEP